MNTKQCWYRSAFAALTLLVAFGVAGAGTTFHGVLNPNTHVVWIDTAIVTAPPAIDTFLTTGWGSASAAYDTFDFPDLASWPLLIELRGSVDTAHTQQILGAPENGRWYVFTAAPPPPPKVQFYGETGIEEPGTVIAPVRMTVSPGYVTGQLTVRLQGARPGRQVVELWDAAGNMVRALDCVAGANGLAIATWNRADANGRLVPGGVYFCRYAAPGAVCVRKVLVAH